MIEAKRLKLLNSSKGGVEKMNIEELQRTPLLPANHTIDNFFFFNFQFYNLFMAYSYVLVEL